MMLDPAYKGIIPERKQTSGTFSRSSGFSRAASKHWSLSKAVEHGFKKSGPLFVSVDWVAKALSSLPWVVMRLSPQEEWERQKGHRWEVLIEYPNEKMTRKFLMHLMAQHILLCGEAILKKAPTPNPTELWPMNPDSVLPITSQAEWISGYEVTENDKKETLGTEELVRAIIPDPSKPYLGMSPVEPVSREVDVDISASEWQASTLRNGARTSGALVDPGLDPVENADVIEQVEERFARDHEGPENAGKAMFLTGGATWIPMSQTSKDLDLVPGRQATAVNIGMALGQMASIFSAEAQTYDNLQTAVRWMMEGAVLPLADIFADAFTLALVPKGDRRRMKITYDSSKVKALQKDLGKSIEAHERAVRSGIPINESLEMFEIPVDPVEDGDRPLVAAGLEPLADKYLGGDGDF